MELCLGAWISRQLNSGPCSLTSLFSGRCSSSAFGVMEQEGLCGSPFTSLVDLDEPIMIKHQLPQPQKGSNNDAE